ncbi:MAG: MBL fold metallo-hydrolase [Candidatus Kapaibacterium sp.]
MRKLRIAIIVLIALFAGVTLAALLMPDIYRVDKSIIINTDRERAYDYLKNPADWFRWAVWLEGSDYIYKPGEIPKIEATTPEAELHSLRFTEFIEDSLVQVEFTRVTDLNSVVRISLRAEDGGVKLLWNEFGETGSHPARRLMMNLFMESFFGPEIDRSLNDLKSILENKAFNGEIQDEKMNVRIIYDNSAHPGLDSGWGFSAIVGGVMFDTGNDFTKLIGNIKKLEIDPQSIRYLVLSHEHRDHTGGALELVGMLDSLQAVYVCKDFDDSQKAALVTSGATVVEADTATEITDNIYTSGSFPVSYHGGAFCEQALVMRHNAKIGIITGCSHPGIVEIAEKCRLDFAVESISFIAGGFHTNSLNNRELKALALELRSLGVERAAPMHCSGRAAYPAFREVFGDSALKLAAGDLIGF